MVLWLDLRRVMPAYRTLKLTCLATPIAQRSLDGIATTWRLPTPEPGRVYATVCPSHAFLSPGQTSINCFSNTLLTVLAICGDGIVIPPEQCDDKVSPPASGDGCDRFCVVEWPLWECSYDELALKTVCTRMNIAFLARFVPFDF
jgi:cysteine-rich repeat protein